MSDATPPADGPTKDQLKAAMKAFKKRLKLTRLDQESRISARPTTTGCQARIVAVRP